MVTSPASLEAVPRSLHPAVREKITKVQQLACCSTSYAARGPLVIVAESIEAVAAVAAGAQSRQRNLSAWRCARRGSATRLHKLETSRR